MKLKKERLDKLISKLTEDSLLFKKFKFKKKDKDSLAVKTKMTLQGMNPEIQAIEMMFTPASADERDIMRSDGFAGLDDDQVESNYANQLGVFIQRNLNIAPYFKEYTCEKRKIYQNINL